MTFKEISKMLGFKTIDSMMCEYGYTRQQLHSIKRLNPKRYELIKIEIILKHNKIGVHDLVNIIELSKKIKALDTH